VQFITSLFGGSGNSILTAVFALGIVLVLIVLGVWLLKLVFNASSNVARGRNRRLSIVDTMPLDPKRQLIIVRRDNVEHLILTGGPQDVVVETGIPVEEIPAGQTSRRPLPVAVPRQPPRPAVQPPAAIVPDMQAEKPNAIQRLRNLGKSAEVPANAKSLRHTGLMRASEPVVPDNSDRQRPDSAKEDAAQLQGESAELGDDNGNPQREAHTTDRN
jgi:flagellar protein FliO/FliZ